MAETNEVLDLDESSDTDSALGSLATNDTETLSTWITKFRQENGRTYHSFKDGKYWGPNDEQAQEHLDIAHHMFTLALENRLYLAPISPDLSDVLDIGTGTGLWAVDFADQHPSASVLGTDLSPIQPTWLPPNLKFEIDDCELEWTYPEAKFDFIHVRTLFGCIADWPRFYRQVVRHLKPGGYFEQVEISPGATSDDGTVNMANTMGRWHIEGIEAGRKIGRTFEIVWLMYDLIREAGFEEIVEKKYKLPLGTWPKDKKLKEIGMWSRAHVDAGLENWCLALLTRVMGWTYDEVMAHVARARADLWDKSIHGWNEMRVVYGRKPLA